MRGEFPNVLEETFNLRSLKRKSGAMQISINWVLDPENSM